MPRRAWMPGSSPGMTILDFRTRASRKPTPWRGDGVRDMTGRPLLDWRGWGVFLPAGFVLLVVLPLMNAWAAAGSAFSLPNYLVPLLRQYACYAILGLSLHLVWCYA